MTLNFFKKLFFITFLGGSVFANDIEIEDLNAIEFENSKSVKASNIHGIIDVAFKNDYVTLRGLLVTNTGLTIQILSGFVFDIYKAKNQLIDSFSLNFGAWNDLWIEQENRFVGAWNEFDWFIGGTLVFQNQLRFQAQFIEFVSPPHNFTPENNAEFILSYNDGAWKFPITFNPYFKLFWAISGDSTVVVGKRGGTYYLEFGLVPTITFNKNNTSLKITFPTWFSVGPSHFWNGGKLALKHNHSNLGIFSTGIYTKIPLKFISNKVGDWYMSIGFQFYHLINDNLLQAQVFTIQASSFRSAYRNIGVASLSLGFEF